DIGIPVLLPCSQAPQEQRSRASPSQVIHEQAGDKRDSLAPARHGFFDNLTAQEKLERLAAIKSGELGIKRVFTKMPIFEHGQPVEFYCLVHGRSDPPQRPEVFADFNCLPYKVYLTREAIELFTAEFKGNVGLPLCLQAVSVHEYAEEVEGKSHKAAVEAQGQIYGYILIKKQLEYLQDEPRERLRQLLQQRAPVPPLSLPWIWKPAPSPNNRALLWALKQRLIIPPPPLEEILSPPLKGKIADTKLYLPFEFAQAIKDGFFFFRNYEDVLSIVPAARYARELKILTPWRRSMFKQRISGGMRELERDSKGFYIALSQPLQNSFGLKPREVLLVSVLDRFEVWPPEKWASYQKQHDKLDDRIIRYCMGHYSGRYERQGYFMRQNPFIQALATVLAGAEYCPEDIAAICEGCFSWVNAELVNGTWQCDMADALYALQKEDFRILRTPKGNIAILSDSQDKVAGDRGEGILLIQVLDKQWHADVFYYLDLESAVPLAKDELAAYEGHSIGLIPPADIDKRPAPAALAPTGIAPQSALSYINLAAALIGVPLAVYFTPVIAGFLGLVVPMPTINLWTVAIISLFALAFGFAKHEFGHWVEARLRGLDAHFARAPGISGGIYVIGSRGLSGILASCIGIIISLILFKSGVIPVTVFLALFFADLIFALSLLDWRYLLAPRTGHRLGLKTLKVGPQSLAVVDKEEINPELIQPQQVIIPEENNREVSDLAEAALSSGSVGVITAAGGMSTRAGLSYPKGVHPIEVVCGKTLFARFADELLAARYAYGKPVVWFIMTSDVTDSATREYFAGNNYFGLGRENVVFIRQESVPAFIAGTREVAMADTSTIFTSPNGNGGLFRALRDPLSRTDGGKISALEEARNRGIITFFYCAVDNPMPVLNKKLLGCHLKERSDSSVTLVGKKDALEGLAMMAEDRVTGESFLIEYNQPAAAAIRDRPGYEYGSISRFVFSLNFLTTLEFPPCRLVRNKAARLFKDGRLQDARVDKFEYFFFDVQSQAKASINVVLPREECFAPFKQMQGKDSPLDVARAISDLAKKRLWDSGRAKEISAESKLEFSPAFATSAAEIKTKVGNNLRIQWQSCVYLGGKHIKIGDNVIVKGRLQIDFEDPYDGSFEIKDESVVNNLVIRVGKGEQIIYPKVKAAGGTILLVDNYYGIRVPVAQLLRDEGYLVKEATNAQQAKQQIEELEQNGEKLALIIVEVYMPWIHSSISEENFVKWAKGKGCAVLIYSGLFALFLILTPRRLPASRHPLSPTTSQARIWQRLPGYIGKILRRLRHSDI
ncbi:MAG: UTP--glucose-1-phosphate uridylyltransferase, partial [Candidatus Omnitrophica bacterium]|nr:UTP--glucose-1-phosphate uridylyltransferase [Candidatus Omnitrophota bacterium]